MSGKNQNENNFTAYAGIFLAGILWGTIGIWATLLGRFGMDAMQTAFYRLLSATVILFFVLLIKGRGVRYFRISRQGLLSCALIGLISQAAYNYAYMYAVQSVGVSVAAVLLYTSPIFAALISRIALKETMMPRKILAIAVNILGCIITVTGGSSLGAGLHPAGIAMGIAAGLAYGVMPILSRIGADREEAYTASFYGLAIGTLALGLVSRPLRAGNLIFSRDVFLVLLGFGLVPSALAYILYFGGLGKVKETSKVPVICSVETVAAAVFGHFLFREPFTLRKVVGISLVLLSILILNQNRIVRDLRRDAAAEEKSPPKS